MELPRKVSERIKYAYERIAKWEAEHFEGVGLCPLAHEVTVLMGCGNLARELEAKAALVEELMAAASNVLRHFTPEHLDAVSGSRVGTQLKGVVGKAEKAGVGTKP